MCQEYSNIKIEFYPVVEKPVIHMSIEFALMLKDYHSRESLVPVVKLLRSIFKTTEFTLGLKEARAIIQNVSVSRYVATYHNMVVVSLETDL